MSQFNGFYPETPEVLLGIRFNNNKEWFHQHKQEYKEYVHDPMVLLADELYEKMRTMDKDFEDMPRVCRANRDTRFSKNKAPYKEHKWFFLRKGNISSIEYELPNYFFEIMPEGYRYGLGFWPGPKAMGKLRDKMEARPAEAEAIVKVAEKQKAFQLEGDVYKKPMKNNPGGILEQWYIRKTITIITYRDNDKEFYSKALVDHVFRDFKALYPIYQYFQQL